MLTIIGQLLVAGIAFGAIYAIVAIAFSLIYRATRTINFAQGYLAMLGAYVTLAALSAPLSLPYPLAMALGVLAVTLASVVIEVFGFRPLYRSGAVLVIVSSIALTFVLETLMQLGWGAQSVRLRPVLAGAFEVGGVVVSWQHIVILAGLAVSVGLLNVLLRSRIGRAMRATAENPEIAGIVGIRPRLMVTFSFAVAGVLTGVAGILVAPLTYLEPSSGGSLGLLAVVAAIVGGLGNLFGAVLGGFIIGLVNVFGAYLIGGNFVEMTTFAVLLLVLLLRPEGIFGEEGTAVRG